MKENGNSVTFAADQEKSPQHKWHQRAVAALFMHTLSRHVSPTHPQLCARYISSWSGWSHCYQVHGSAFSFPAAQIGCFFFSSLFPTFATMDLGVVVFAHVWSQLLSKTKLLESEVGSAQTYRL